MVVVTASSSRAIAVAAEDEPGRPPERQPAHQVAGLLAVAMHQKPPITIQNRTRPSSHQDQGTVPALMPGGDCCQDHDDPAPDGEQHHQILSNNRHRRALFASGTGSPISDPADLFSASSDCDMIDPPTWRSVRRASMTGTSHDLLLLPGPCVRIRSRPPLGLFGGASGTEERRGKAPAAPHQTFFR